MGYDRRKQSLDDFTPDDNFNPVTDLIRVNLTEPFEDVFVYRTTFQGFSLWALHPDFLSEGLREATKDFPNDCLFIVRTSVEGGQMEINIRSRSTHVGYGFLVTEGSISSFCPVHFRDAYHDDLHFQMHASPVNASRRE